ncbi:hydrogen gas-evolving membrane-bound hydrogenase subunit E [Vibrio salilacus]|uniref:hydrogen gas-evolving membrane-bound hydrogenase subunit E n=1 Tax=Vibrio salilacus TaxID=1323749 RepID=UPI000C2B1DE9|nr:hydrogen gas-evolving membrane-bound hydrogenase subunit E [Vibrio salilacus]
MELLGSEKINQHNRRGGDGFLLLFAALPFGLLVAILSAYLPQGWSYQVDWIPSLGIPFALRLDGLSLVFAALITGIGTLVQIYAWSYLRHIQARFSFHLYLTLFMLAMLGIVLSDNILLLFVFWELTTITSYLLIGFNHEKPVARKNALQALLITGGGGLALLAGLILLGMMADSYQLAVIIERAPLFIEHDAFVASLILILIGAFTKSAQFPFHFWLPNAMAAPTPVSAYLHSATMVKAGIYLLARVSPIYANHEIWFYSLTITGSVTAIWCALLAIKQTDLKLMLAYSTNVALGTLTLLLGIATELAVLAALIFILAHSLYKAALFMVIGNIDKATGTRDLKQLKGLKSFMVLSFIAATGAALSKAGFPPLLGFISKEYMYKAALDIGVIPSIVLLLVNILMVTMALIVVIKPFLSKTTSDSPPVKRIEYDMGLWLPALFLAFSSVLIPLIGLDWLSEYVLTHGVSAVSPNHSIQDVKLWHGLNTALLMSVVTLLLGLVLYRYSSRSIDKLSQWVDKMPSADVLFDQSLKGLMLLANIQTNLLQKKRLSLYAAISFLTLALFLLTFGAELPDLQWESLLSLAFYQLVIAALIVAAVGIVLRSRSRLLSVASLGVIGFLTTLVFMIFSAPDVAKTLLLVETLMVVFVVILMHHLPSLNQVPQHTALRRLLHGAIALVVGGSITILLIAITAQPLDTSVSDFFAQNSLPGGYGRNIVNVILVDFRAFDTLGEVVVVVIAGLAAVSLLPKQNRYINRVQSLIFTTTAHIVATLMLVFSVYLLLRGHNAPGGGFIGALIAVLGLSLLMLAESPSYVKRRIYFSPFGLALTGISLSISAGVVGLILGQAFLTGLWWKDILPIGTPLLFDVGIYLAVIGGVMGMMLRVNEELD